MKLLADENLHLGIIQGLRKAKFEVIFVPDIDLAGHIIPAIHEIP